MTWAHSPSNVFVAQATSNLELLEIIFWHSSDVIMDAMASHITSLTSVYSTVYIGADQRKHQSSASLALCGEFIGDRWRGKCLHLMTSSWYAETNNSADSTMLDEIPWLSGVPDLFDRNKILSGGDLSHYEVPHCIRVFFYFVWFVFIHHYTPPAQRSCWGGILVSLRPSVRPSVCPSVRLSVCPSVPHAVSALYHLQLWMDSFHVRHKWSLPWEDVSRTMTFDLDLYLQGHSALT